MQERQKAPQAVDFHVPPGVSVVTLTGPNTGGKTASLKALGLTAAMAKAGLFLPLKAPEGMILRCAYPPAHTPAPAKTDKPPANLSEPTQLHCCHGQSMAVVPLFHLEMSSSFPEPPCLRTDMMHVLVSLPKPLHRHQHSPYMAISMLICGVLPA